MTNKLTVSRFHITKIVRAFRGQEGIFIENGQSFRSFAVISIIAKRTAISNLQPITEIDKDEHYSNKN